MTATEQQISELHRWFCERTGLQTKLCFAQRLWFEMLRSYENNADSLRADADLIIRYLKREIARDKRNLGALKLINFLQPDNFDADLAIARMAISKTGSRKVAAATKEEARADEQTRSKISEGLRSFRKSMAGGQS